MPGRAAEPGRLVPDPASLAGTARRSPAALLRRPPERGRAGIRHLQGTSYNSNRRSSKRRLVSKRKQPRRRKPDRRNGRPNEYRNQGSGLCPNRSAMRRWSPGTRSVGEAVSRDENLVDLETDKVVLEVPAPTAGVLQEIKIERRCHGDGRRNPRHSRRGRRPESSRPSAKNRAPEKHLLRHRPKKQRRPSR